MSWLPETLTKRWEGKTGLPKLATIFSTILLISLGLCGVNFFGVILFVPIGGGAPPPPSWRDLPAYLFGFGAYAELFGIAVGLLGLLCVGWVATWRWISPKLFRTNKSEE